MDPLTHTLVGANLASTRWVGKTRLGAAACLIGANAPDIDVSAYFAGGDFAIGFRRGWTHGVLAIVVLPVVLWGLLLAWDRMSTRQAARVPVHAGWLFGLCAVAVLTHPFLDWLNVYGMRWLMPIDPTWLYGDAVFIMDPWLWLILAGTWLVPRRPTKSLATVWVVFTGLLALVVAGRAPHYLPLIATIALILLGALVWKPGEKARRHRFGLIGLGIAGLYIVGMIALHQLTEDRVRNKLISSGVDVDELMVGPLPVDSLSWDLVARTGNHYRFGSWSWWNRELDLSEKRLPLPYDSEYWETVSNDPSIEGFMTWVRYPWIETERIDGDVHVWVLDARYTRSRRAGFGGVSVVVDE